MRLLSLVLCLFAGSVAGADEWPRFRGPNGSGVSMTAVIPSAWTEVDYHWKIQLPGGGHSSPVVWGKRIFVTSADEQGKRYLNCVHVDDGRTLWQHELAGKPQRMHKDNSQASATPAVDAHAVYVCWGNAVEYLVIALSHEGHELWRIDLGPYQAGHGFGGSAIVHDGILLVPNEQNGTSSLVALDSRTGKTLWRQSRKSKAHYATPCIFRPAVEHAKHGRAAEAIFASWEHGISSLDPKTGATNWEVDVFYKDHLECSIASPIVAGDMLLATCGYLGVNYETVAVKPYVSSGVQTVYRLNKIAPLVPTPLVKDDLLFLLNDRGILTCANVADGTEHWRQRVTADVYSSPVCAGNRLVCISRDGEAVVVAADRTFAVLGRSTLGETTHATPALAHGRMYLRTLSHLMALGGARDNQTVQPIEVRKLYADGKHNAFTALTRFRDHFYLAFRTARDHNSGDGDIVVLRSADGKDWRESFRLNADTDDRDPQFAILGKRLFLYDPAVHAKGLTTYAVYTEDGAAWSKPQPVYEPQYILWKPCLHNGKLYAAAHKRDNTSGGKGRDVHLIVSQDGLNWQKISTIRAGKWESETTMYFDERGHATAFLRQKYGSPAAQALESDPPYTEWKARPAGVPHLSGHCVHTFNGVTYLLSRTMDRAAMKTGCAIFTLADGKLTPYCELPAGGDCAYAEAVQVGDEMLVSYYSTHEGTTNIYLARVPLKK